MFPIEEDEEVDRAPGLPKLAQDPRGELAFKAGFVSLRERLSQWTRTRQASMPPAVDDRQRSFVESFKQEHQPASSKDQPAAQFATLHEFFQSKTSLKQQLEQEEAMRQQRRPKLPIMKLRKDDWNVKCWEERFKPLGAQRREANNKENDSENKSNVSNKNSTSNKQAHLVAPNRAQKPERQLEVFHGRISEVAQKLDRMREGAPQDEQLERLARNKLRDLRPGHSWTDLLKSELSEGVHNVKLLKWRLSRDAQTVVKSPLGRPIGRICPEEEEDGDEDG